MKIHGIVVLWLLLASTLSAQTVPPALMVKKDGVSTPLGLHSLKTEVRIFGSVAETTTTMTFTNPTARAMEGDLYFPLPEGATIGGYALDINGVMVDGVAVEKHEARRVFESVVRKGIDPGLVQWTKGNNFQTRVFPIPANGSRTVRVQYVSELSGDKNSPVYQLPLRFKEKLPEFSLRVEVVKSTSSPTVTKGGPANFAFEKWRESYVAETKLQDWKPSDDLVIALPKTEGPQVIAETADDGQVYFAIQDYPAAPAETTLSKSLTRPQRIVIFWDASGSRAGDHKREIALLRAYFERWPFPMGHVWPADGGPAQSDWRHALDIHLVLLRNVASKPKHFKFSKEGLDSLVAELEKVQYDGGTQLGAIGPVAGAEKPDLYLLFSDGISNFGQEQPGTLDAPLYAFSAGGGANHAFLHGLALANRGQYFNLANWKDADAVGQIGRVSPESPSAKMVGGDAMDLCPALPAAATREPPAGAKNPTIEDLAVPLRLPSAGRFTLVGKFKGETATVTLNEAGGKRTFTIALADAVEGSLLRRLWAQKRLADLMIFEKRNEKEIATLGKQYGLVTPCTSLLVLDSLDQYVEHEIMPPKSLGKMREEYLQRIDTLEHQREKKKAEKLEEVVQMWQERVKWWETAFKVPKDFKYKGDEDGVEGGGQGQGGMGGMGGGMGGPRLPSAPAAEPAGEAPKTDEQKGAESLPGLYSPSRVRSMQTLGREYNRLRRTADVAESSAAEPEIAIKPWNPDTPYLKELRAAKGKGDLMAVYMNNRAKYGTSPAFFLDCADFFREAGNDELAIQILSNVAELELEDASLLRVLAYRLLQIGQLDLAVQTFEAALAMRPEEPQSYRDLALALARRASLPSKDNARPPEAIRQDFARAVDLLSQVVLRRWDSRFPQIEVIALEELNHLLPRAKVAGVSNVSLDPRLLKLLAVDIRIVMTWQADDTDIDLWVTEPSGEKAYYGHNRTTIGGLVSNDFTGGYGPEEYMVRKAIHGKYKIESNYFGSRAARLLGPVMVQVDVFTNYGRENEQRKSLTLRLKESQETIPIGEIEF